MRIEIVIFLVTAFLIYNTYHDGKYTKMLLSWKKYYQMAFIGLIGIGIVLFMRKNPSNSKKLLLYANNFVKYMPIDKSSLDTLSPIIDFTNGNISSNDSSGYGGFMNELNNITGMGMGQSGGSGLGLGLGQEQGQQVNRRMLQSGKNATKRSVSETKKKYVASMQDWKCGECGDRLNAWFEVDHKVRLEYGGGNDVQNLVALCRECHGKKTAMENM
jgi:hypothetical protein